MKFKDTINQRWDNRKIDEFRRTHFLIKHLKKIQGYQTHRFYNIFGWIWEGTYDRTLKFALLKDKLGIDGEIFIDNEQNNIQIKGSNYDNWTNYGKPLNSVILDDPVTMEKDIYTDIYVSIYENQNQNGLISGFAFKFKPFRKKLLKNSSKSSRSAGSN